MKEIYTDNLPGCPGVFAVNSQKNRNSIYVGNTTDNPDQFIDWADFYLKINLWLLDQLGIDNRHFEIVRRTHYGHMPVRADVIFFDEGIVMAKLYGLID